MRSEAEGIVILLDMAVALYRAGQEDFGAAMTHVAMTATADLAAAIGEMAALNVNVEAWCEDLAADTIERGAPEEQVASMIERAREMFRLAHEIWLKRRTNGPDQVIH